MGLSIANTAAFAEAAKYKAGIYRSVTKTQPVQMHQQTIVIQNPNYVVISQPQWVVKRPHTGQQNAWYSPHNAFKVAKRPDTPALPADWSQQLQRGSHLSENLYRQGRVVYRSPVGVARMRIGNITIQLDEPSRVIHGVIQP